MFSQVYLHPVRRVYDLHLKDFLREWLPQDIFPTSTDEFLKLSDIEVLAAIRHEARNGSDPAWRISERRHFKEAYTRNPDDLHLNLEPGKAVSQALINQFGEDKVKLDYYVPTAYTSDFPVLLSDGRIASSLTMSDMLQHIPIPVVDSVFVEPSIRDQARIWINQNREQILIGNAL